jgi:hypothetical protein
VLTGTANLEELTARCATLESFSTDAVTISEVQMMLAVFEIRLAGRQRALPSGLHPTNPPSFALQFWSCPDSPWGPFRMAQGRVGCRSGLRTRGFVQGCIVDNPDAASALRSRWGFPATLGEVTLRSGYDMAQATATVDGSMVVKLTGIDPEPLGADDIAFTTTVSLADSPRGLRLVQIDADVRPTRAERLRPRLEAFTATGWVHESIEPYYPVSAAIAVGDVTLQRLRYVSKPEELAFSGTEPVGDSA